MACRWRVGDVAGRFLCQSSAAAASDTHYATYNVTGAIIVELCHICASDSARVCPLWNALASQQAIPSSLKAAQTGSSPAQHQCSLRTGCGDSIAMLACKSVSGMLGSSVELGWLREWQAPTCEPALNTARDCSVLTLTLQYCPQEAGPCKLVSRQSAIISSQQLIITRLEVNQRAEERWKQ